MIEPRTLRRAGVALAGTTVLGLGVAMIVLPGPAVLVIPAGLGILALEFDWARNAVQGVRRWSRAPRSEAKPGEVQQPEVRRRFAAARAAGSRGGVRRSLPA